MPASVAVVTADTVRNLHATIELLRQDNNVVAIAKGLSAGDLVVTEGVQKVRPGQVVDPTEVKPEV